MHNGYRQWPKIYFLIPVLILFVLVSIVNISIPFVGLHEGNSLWHSIAAVNYLKNGYLASNLIPYINGVPYINHPVLLPILLSIWYQIFGVSDLSGRIFAIGISVASLLFIYLIGKKIFNRRTALFAVIVALLLPMFMLYGKMINYEVITLMFILASMYFFLSSFKEKRKLIFALFIVSSSLSMLSDWPAYFMVPFFLFVLCKEGDRIRILVYLATITGCIIVNFGLIIGEDGNGIMGLVKAFLERSGGDPSISGIHMIWWKWMAVIVLRILIYFNPVLLFVVLICLLVSKRRCQFNSSFGYRFILFSFCGLGVLNITVFARAAFVHSYWLYYLLPFFIFSIALSLDFLCEEYVWIRVSLWLAIAYCVGVVSVFKYEEYINIELYSMVKNIEKQFLVGRDYEILVMADRQIEQYVPVYYLDEKIRLVSNYTSMHNYMEKNNNVLSIIIFNSFSQTDSDYEIPLGLFSEYHYYKIQGERFSCIVIGDIENFDSSAGGMYHSVDRKDNHIANVVGYIMENIRSAYIVAINFLGVPEI